MNSTFRGLLALAAEVAAQQPADFSAEAAGVTAGVSAKTVVGGQHAAWVTVDAGEQQVAAAFSGVGAGAQQAPAAVVLPASLNTGILPSVWKCSHAIPCGCHL
jgi:hypothetical protein